MGYDLPSQGLLTKLTGPGTNPILCVEEAEDGEERKEEPEEREDCPEMFVFGAWNGCCTHDLTAAVVACI